MVAFIAGTGLLALRAGVTEPSAPSGRNPDEPYLETAAQLGVPEALFDGPASMVGAVERLRSDAARRRYLDRSQRRCWESYSPGRIAEAFARVFYECLGGLPPADAASAGPASA